MDEQNFGHKSFVFWRERSFKTATLGFDTISIIWPRWNLHFRAKNKHYLHMTTAKEVIFIHFSHHFHAKAFKIWGVISLLNLLQLAFIFYCVLCSQAETYRNKKLLVVIIWVKSCLLCCEERIFRSNLRSAIRNFILFFYLTCYFMEPTWYIPCLLRLLMKRSPNCAKN